MGTREAGGTGGTGGTRGTGGFVGTAGCGRTGGDQRDFNETTAVAMSTKPTSIGSEQTSDQNRNISERQSAATYNNDETQKDGRTQSYERTEMRGQR